MSEIAKPSVQHKVQKFIRSYPTLFGMVLGLILVVGIIVIEEWFPRVDDAWQRNNANVRSVFFTLCFFAIWISRLWRWRRRNAIAFWSSVSGLALVHSFGVIYYSKYVHPLALGQWIVLIAVESFPIVFIMDWVTRRFERRVHDQITNSDNDM